MKRINKIVITGPESTGKTTLTKELAQFYGEPWVEEYARTYLQQLGREYLKNDMELIAKGQLDLEEKREKKADRFLFCDTDLITIKIWSTVKYGNCSSEILDMIDARQYDLYLLCQPDITWTPDPQREHPTQRNMLYELYKKELHFYNKQFVEIGGQEDERMQMAVFHLSSIFS